MGRTIERWTAALTESMGSITAIVGSIVVVLIWAGVGPLFAFSDTWQLVINTGTTIITFNMVFVIQNTANRDARAMHAKLDALLDAVQDQTDLELVGAENMPLSDIKAAQQRVQREAEEHAL